MVESYQKLKKWYLMSPCLTLSIKRYESRVKWVNPGKGGVPSPRSWCSSYQKGSPRVTLGQGICNSLSYYNYCNLYSKNFLSLMKNKFWGLQRLHCILTFMVACFFNERATKSDKYIYIYICINERPNCSLPCYIKKKGNRRMRMRILMNFKKFNDWQKDSPCAVSVTYWPSTEPSIKRCTCVNKRKQVDVRQLYNQVPQTVWVSQFQLELESVGYKMPNWEPAAEGFAPSVTHGWAAQPECERSAAMVRRTWGQYVAACTRLQLTSHTQETSPFRE